MSTLQPTVIRVAMWHTLERWLRNNVRSTTLQGGYSTGKATLMQAVLSAMRLIQSIQEVGLRNQVKGQAKRPPTFSPLSAINHVKSIAPPPLTTRKSVLIIETEFTKELCCPLCLERVQSPIELSTCSTIVCSDCLCEWLRVSESLSCACCYSEHLTTATRSVQHPK